MDVIRMAAPVSDMPAAYAAADRWSRPRCSRRACNARILEAQAMARPVIVSDLGAGPDVVLTAARGAGRAASPACAFMPATTPRWPPRCCGCSRCREAERRAIGARGREWVFGHFNRRRRSPRRRCGSMARSSPARKPPPLARRLNEIESDLNDLTPFCGLLPPGLRNRVDLFAVSTNLSWSRGLRRQETLQQHEETKAIRRPMKSALPVAKDGPRINEEIRVPRGPADRYHWPQSRPRPHPNRLENGRRRPGSISSRSPPTRPRPSARSWITANTNSRRRKRRPKPARNRRSSRSRRSSSGR